MSGEPNEDLIEATIRRVAEAKALRDAASTDGATPGDAEPQTATSVAAGAAPDAPPDATGEPEPAPPGASDEALIEATIRRVAAAKAAGEAADALPARPADAAPPVRSAAPRPVAWAPSDGAPNERTELLALQREVHAMRGMLGELQERVDGALGATSDGAPLHSEDDGWDDTPVLPRLAIGAMPRPPVLRTPAPRGAVAEALDPDPDEAHAPAAPPPHHGLDLLPRTYRVTVEDKRRGVDLVPLHRALLAMDGVRDMSLLSYSNGVAMVSVDMVHPLDPEVLREAVAGAMLRGARVESHNETTMVVKLAEE